MTLTLSNAQAKRIALGAQGFGDPRPTTLIDDATRDGELFEYWVHEASLVPIDQYHLYRWRMDAPYPWPGFRRRIEQQRTYIEQVYRRVVEEGPLVAGDLKARVGKQGTWSSTAGSALAGDRTTSPASTTWPTG